MENKRGRPPVVEKETFVDTILANKAKIYVDECVVVKQHAVWTDLSLIFGKRLTPRSIYSMVVNNRYQILNQLSGSLEKKDDSVNSQTDKSIDLLNASDIEKVYNKRLITFHSDISVEDMEKLTTYVEYSKSTREAKAGKRKYRRFKTGIYQPYFSKMIRDNTELICGWNFANQYINIPATDGKIQVYCRCGSQGSIVLCRYSEDQNVRLTCQITPGTGKKCGPQYLRAEERRNEVVPRIIDEGSVDQYRAACSREMGLKIGQTKPQILRNSNVLHVAKTKETKLKYLHEDPIEALDIMKCTIHLNEIHDIGKNPFFVDFFSNEQIQICKMIRKKDGRLVLCMDATGLKMDSIKRSHSSEQRKIFLYIISTNTDVGQTTVSQRLGERHKSSDLVTFLNHYHSCGAPHPDEFVSDRGRSILNAAVRVYTNYENIDQYASNMQYPVEVRRYDSIHDYVKTLEVPYSEETRIRVDNAHFLSNYRSLFKGISIRGVYTFYMAGVDQLMLALDLKDAKEILRALFIVSNCPRTGFLPDGRPTECSKSISFLKQLTHGIDKDTAYPNTDDLDSSESEMFIHETNDTVECEDSTSNRWKKWGEDIYDNCKGHFDDQGSDDNLYWIKNIKLSDTLKRDVSLIPIWGNIFSPFYEGCRIPASTAGCEGEINKIKSYWRGKKLHSIRPDVFVHETLEFLKGKLPILASDLQEAHNQNEKNSEENSFECNICTKSLIAKEAYACNYCQNFVHKNKCTEDIEEKLFCKKCSKDKVVIRNASSKTVENWGGFGEPRSGKSEKNQQTIEKIKPVDFLSQEHNKYRLCSKYHGKRPDDVRDSEVFYKSSSFPVIRNGNDPKLEKQIINKQPTILQNTCSFDAVLYLALFAAHDYPNVNKQFDQLKTNENKFYELVLHLLEKKVQKETYTLRAKILNYLEIPQEPSKLFTDLYVMKCQREVGWMAQQLFKTLPSIEEETKCLACLYTSTKKLTGIRICDADLTSTDEEVYIRKFCEAPSGTCPECSAKTVTTITKIDCLHLQLYRDSKDRYKQGQTKASLSLEHFLGLETGFTLDKESNTVAILCQDVVVVLAFDNRERLMQWQVKLSSHLNDGPHFLVLVSSAPPKSRLPPGPARLHVQERGFCLTTGVPPRVAGQWLISNLRRYGVVEGRFCFEGGSRCIKGEGLYVLLTDQGEEITTTLKAASVGNLHSSRRRPVSRNMSVMDSPRRGPLRALGGIGLELSESSLHSRADSPYTDMESNYGCGDSISNDGWGPPPIERCMSCISKLGAMSRSSTATITMGAPPCWEHTCDRHSISSSSDSSGWSQAVTKPPARPPKPGTSSPSPKKPAAPPPQPSYDNYDIPKIPFPVEPKVDEHYDTPRKLKECMQGFGFDTVQKPCGCIVRIRQPEPERPCVCQRLMSCWSGTEDVHAIYATVDYSKKTHRQQPVATVANYANLAPMPTLITTTATTTSNYENMEFAQTLQLYENGKEIAEKARNLCTKCGHAQEDYLMMEPSNKPSQPHPGYIPMSPAVKQRLGKVLSNSNPNLGPALDRSIKPSGSSMLQGTIYQRKQLLDNVDNLDLKRRRSNSADSSTSRFEPEPEPETSPCHCTIAVRRSSSVPCKSNRDSSSSNDSGVFELPRKPQICANQTLPRRSKSSDPLRDLTFQFTKTETKSASAEAEVPVCPSGSTSSGTSDMSDYFETLSLSSHSSSDAPPPSCTLRPRSGNEYLSMQRLIAPVPEERH